MAKKNIVVIVLFILIGGFIQINTLKITSLNVPKTAWDTVTLNCRYDLEGEQLYGVKWYKDGTEFFRCLADGNVQEFPLGDIRIYYSDRAQIGSCYFELTALTNRSGGLYTCEVSLDWPTFKTVQETAILKISEPIHKQNNTNNTLQKTRLITAEYNHGHMDKSYYSLTGILFFILIFT